MTYNLTGVADSTNILGLLEAANTLSDGFLITGGLIVLWAVLFMVLLRFNPPQESILAASLACGVLSVAFMTADLISVLWVTAFTLLTVGAAVSLYVGG